MYRGLTESWTKLWLPEDGAYETLLIHPNLCAKFLLGINQLGNRCFILEEKISAAKQFSAVQRDNITLKWDSTNEFFVLELIDEKFSEHFDELIFSILDKVERAGTKGLAARVYVQTIREWVHFFEHSKRKLTFEDVLGLYGELIVLRRLLELHPKEKINTVRGWKGPLKEPRDFAYPDLLIEVKTTIEPKSVVSISNELQLDYPGNEQNLYLALVQVSIDSDGQSLSELVEEMSSVLRVTDDGMRVFLSLLQHVGGSVASFNDYDHHRFKVQSVIVFDAGNSKFPAIRKSEMPCGLSKTEYLLETTECEVFRLTNHPLSQ